MKILTAEEMGAADRLTAEKFGGSVQTLMEAGRQAGAAYCLRQYAGVSQVGVLCGKGNNGGDGLVAARVLAQAGLRVCVLLLGRKDEINGEAAVSLRRLLE